MTNPAVRGKPVVPILAMNEGQVKAAVTTMMLLACADANVSDDELARLRATLQKTAWGKALPEAAVEELLAGARERVHAICQLMSQRSRLDAALSELGQQVGDVPTREAVLALARDVASADGLDDDERVGLDMLIAAFRADAGRVAKL